MEITSVAISVRMTSPRPVTSSQQSPAAYISSRPEEPTENRRDLLLLQHTGRKLHRERDWTQRNLPRGTCWCFDAAVPLEHRVPPYCPVYTRLGADRKTGKARDGYYIRHANA